MLQQQQTQMTFHFKIAIRYKIMIVLPDTTTFDSSKRLVQLVGGVTKANMLKVCDKLDLYVSPNLKKDETARRVAQELLDSSIEILSNLNKQELQNH